MKKNQTNFSHPLAKANGNAPSHISHLISHISYLIIILLSAFCFLQIQAQNTYVITDGSGVYERSIALNAPQFDNDVIDYAGGKLLSGSNTVGSVNFLVETNLSGKRLNGTMTFTYSEEDGIVETQCNASLQVYPNPTT
jgi:hypothetical protein